ncbi:putative CHIP protein [Triangularia verruculosa]|uniref:CHIP protein n=1 Tax=Triangularia verruculosa TaxID=2587418 RepID=A0AAN6XKT4_9PEZI|nr:putative CHIP protein [Triangularia verruculosa]
MSKSQQLKEEGNRHFQKGDYVRAEALYSQALILDPSNPALYTNRAMARLRLSLWDSVITDCDSCLRITPDNLKAHYYLSQAHLALRAYPDALDHAHKAHKLCVASQDRSLSNITAQVLKCKKEKWDYEEKRRKRETSTLEEEMLVLLKKEKEQMLESSEEGEREELTREFDEKIARLREVFEKAREKEEKRREVPEWAVDDITFGFMVDPVITKTGKSYERAAILEHLSRSQTDPLTREPLLKSDLRSNLDLKHACEEFLEENGWAADW